MLKAIYALRIVIGFVAAWQIVGLLPVLSWLGNIESTSGDMWAIAFIKVVVLLISSALFVWLGRIKARFDTGDAPSGELPTIAIAITSVALAGIAAAILIPMMIRNSTQQSNTAVAATTESNDAQAFSASSSTVSQSPIQADPRDALLQMHVEQLSESQYSAAVDRWLESHPEASSVESRNAMSSLLQEVYTQYPRSALGPALDMALKRGQRNASSSIEQQSQPASQTAASNFQCTGTYTQRDSLPLQEFTMNGVFVQISGDLIYLKGAAVFDGSHNIINRLDNGVGFRNSQDETIEGFFNRFSGELSLIDRVGRKNADGSFKLSADATLNCRAANSLF